MKIVYSILGTYNAGGMERVLANKANYLAAKGHELVIITTDQKGRGPNFPLHPAIRQIDLGINYTDDQHLGLLRKIWSFKKRQRLHYKKLQKILFELNADIAISMFDHDAALLHQIKDGSKKLLEIHFSRFKRLQYDRNGLWKVLNKWRMYQDLAIAKKYDRFVVLTNEDLAYWKGLKNIVVIPNAHTFLPTDPALLSAKHALAVGRFDYQKGFDQLIKAWKRINAVCPEWTLDIYGEGPLKKELTDQINQLDLSGRVILHAPVKNIMDVYLESAIVVMTSRYEGLPMALLEAQACGIPMVSFACKCGPRDIIRQDKNGFLIAEGDLDDFVEKVCLLMKDQQLRSTMGNRAREMSENFSEERVMRQWLVLFESLRKEEKV
ncbi:glycosyltransferase family 4 protein [Sphingobacterium sp. BIGb0165]|uniref:glycosyltransferase family 4 protein n=1 Tax=Sphingobacterium sp. BIGb0165 TaxID=2940615 RepID=UPI002169566F|nr:glycosyltransferase family 4 protein [Sphingobacterium sp. BIGb0165]MCS4226496.1 glycosyltransferase involved in cell wall biosynthesis [Sphingobacterium sp. BIGb0165]